MSKPSKKVKKTKAKFTDRNRPFGHRSSCKEERALAKLDEALQKVGCGLVQVFYHCYNKYQEYQAGTKPEYVFEVFGMETHSQDRDVAAKDMYDQLSRAAKALLSEEYDFES